MTIYFSEKLSFHRNLSSSKGARARACANHARNDAQKGCVMQLNGITLNSLCFQTPGSSNIPPGSPAASEFVTVLLNMYGLATQGIKETLPQRLATVCSTQKQKH